MGANNGKNTSNNKKYFFFVKRKKGTVCGGALASNHIFFHFPFKFLFWRRQAGWPRGGHDAAPNRGKSKTRTAATLSKENQKKQPAPPPPKRRRQQRTQEQRKHLVVKKREGQGKSLTVRKKKEAQEARQCRRPTRRP
nr:hypothetical protein [Pandoravirus massiliensis]